MPTDPSIRSAEVVLPGAPLDASTAFFVERLGFRLESIWPADDPTTVVIVGHGLRLRLERDRGGDPGELRVACAGAAAPAQVRAPNGTRVHFVDAAPRLHVPPLRPALVHTRGADAGGWVVGRAGMRYRDLIPGRLGGRYVASHIRLDAAGPVPDYVHSHRVRFQMIFCRRGWVRVVYEDQGPPFVLHAGDAVLQPPEIRHRVLESGDGLEVVELGCPALHETRADHALELPTGRVDAERSFGGQRFARHTAAEASWSPWGRPGFECREFGLGPATGGFAEARVVRAVTSGAAAPRAHEGELQFWYVLAGTATVHAAEREPIALARDDALVVPAGLRHDLADVSRDLELLEVTAPSASRGEQAG